MIAASNNVTQMIKASARKIDARVELYEGSPSVDEYNKTLIQIFNCSDALKSFTVDRVGEQSKFFGVGVCQKLTVVLLDKERTINIEKDSIIEVAFGANDEYTYPCPLFRVETVSRNETNNELTITAYDFLYKAGEHRVSEITATSYSIREFTHMCANILGLPVKIELDESTGYVFDAVYSQGANFNGSETIRQALDDIAEATQTMYYVDWDWKLTFKRLDRNALPVITIDKSQYFSLSNKGNRTLATICHATELGDNISVTSGEGVTQYVRDNAFWETRDDINSLLQNAINDIGGISINQIDLEFRGNWLIEVGDKIATVGKNNDLIYSYLLNDFITYDGGLKQHVAWNYTEHTGETAKNPITIGDALNQTHAIVDKVNKQIDLMVSDTDGVKQEMAQIKLTTDNIQATVTEQLDDHNEKLSQIQLSSDNISASVSRIESNTQNSIDQLQQEIEVVSSKVEATMSAEDIKIEIMKEIGDGVTGVTTTTGYKFDEEGLTISKSGTEISTQITEDGMTISRGDTEVLVVDNVGVQATNLHARTYLIIGNNSRFEDYAEGSRTGCFWIG